MAEELSALDAELDRLGVEAVADSATLHGLANSYAGPLGALSDVDAALNALAVGVDVSAVSASRVLPMPRVSSQPPPPPPLRSAIPPEPPRAVESSAPPPASMRPANPDSGELALPAPSDDLSEHSGELPLDAGDAPESGAFALPPDALGPDEPVTEDVSFVDADIEELVEIDAAGQPVFVDPGRISEADRLVDAEFAELFSDATGEPPLGYGEDDTEIFDSGAIAAIKAKGELEPIENAFNAEELDSAEFEIVMESSNDDRPHESSTSSIPSASTPPEKRPSFLGRLFGRKDE
ncbi:MAG: hypothetical protein ABW252_22920 [Polyangiales bacterium]